MRLKKQYETNPFKDGELKMGIEETYIIGELSKTAMKLYLFIREYSFRMKGGSIIFDISTAKNVCSFKQNKSVYNALNELINSNIIAGTKDSDTFYYNPKFINHEKE